MDKSILEQARNLPILSLQKMCNIRIMTILCNNRNLIKLITVCNFKKELLSRLEVRAGKDWKAVQTMASHLVSEVCNSVIFKERLLEWLWPISYRIMLWKSKYASSVSNMFLQRFFWTDRGRIDNAATIRYIIRNKNISIRKRFGLACSVCLKKEIHEIWMEMSNDDRAYFRKENRETFFPLLFFWVQALEGSGDAFEGFKFDALECAVKEGLLESVRYIFAITSTEKKCEVSMQTLIALFKILRAVCFLEADEIDIGFAMFFGFPDVCQLTIFDFYSVIVLCLLLSHSEDKFFLGLFAERLHSISDNSIGDYLLLIFYNYHLEINSEIDYRKRFTEVWRMIPISAKETIIKLYESTEVFSLLIRDNFPFILEKNAFKKIAELTSTDIKPSKTFFSFHHDKWKFLHFLIKEEIATVSNLKRHRMNILNLWKKRKSNKAAWNAVLRFVRKIGNKTSQQKE